MEAKGPMEKMEAGESTCLEMEAVTYAYGSNNALNGVSFKVSAGEIFGFLGPSGAGKTTTIKLLTAQLKAKKGQILLFGVPIDDVKRDVFDTIGVLSDNSGIYERLSVYENMALFAELLGISKDKIEPLLNRVGLLEDKAKPAGKLSRGMKQRLMLARAVLHCPKLLFLDEPTAALDPGSTQEIHLLLTELNQNGTTIFLTTHRMEEAEKLCHRVAFLNQGQIVAMDSPKALKLKHASNQITAQFASGETMLVSKDVKGLERIMTAAQTDTIETLHSKEPNLEEIFLDLTGRGLQ